MRFSELVDQASEFLRRRERVSYRALKREFDLDDETLEDLKAELVEVKELAVDKDGKMLVWVGAAPVQSSEFQVPSSPQPQTVASSSQLPTSQTPNSELRTSPPPSAERRQLTVLFCDLVGSTALSSQLDPEDYRAVVQRYQQTCSAVIQRHEGYLAQYLGDGLLVYFGYPTAHEDDARRAVRTGLEIITTLQKQVPSPRVGEAAFSPSPFQGEGSTSSASAGEGKNVTHLQNTPHPHLLPQGEKELRRLQVRIGIHTGLVVVGEIGSHDKRELLALGETPNLAARIQGLAEPNTVIISAATQRLIEGQFECQPFGSHLVKGIAAPIAVYHVQSERQMDGHLAGRTTLTPLVGREQEVGLLIDRWEQVKEGRGQAVLLSGEPGIGKSRLAYTLRGYVTNEGSLLFEARCSPYHQHSAFYPLIDVLQRTLLFTRQDSDAEKIAKLEQALVLYNLQETLPLFTALLSLPTPPQYPALTLTPQKQKERTLQALLQLLIAQAERQATVSVWEDLHWADPSSLEFLSLLIEQIPTTKLLLVLTFRPEFTPPWKPRSHLSQLVLNRLGKKQVEAMIAKVAESKGLSAEVVEQIHLKTDGVPLFVEELTKSVVEARGQVTGDGGQNGRTVGPLAIPATLQEALLARLDRLSTARQVAQLGATLGREFSHELIQAVAPLSEAVAPLSEVDLHVALEKLVEAEILYQRGMGEQARYFFKHALIQDTAYQSLLKSTRQQYHQQIAQVLEERFPETKETQPELLAHHYTESSLIEKAIPYWQSAGETALHQSAFIEAENYFTKGIRFLQTLPDTIARTQQEVNLQSLLGSAAMMTKGISAPEVGLAFSRAYDLCQRVENPAQLFYVLMRLRFYEDVRGETQKAFICAEEMMRIAQQMQEPGFLLQAHMAIGLSFAIRGQPIPACEHLAQAASLYDPHQHRSHAFLYGIDPKVGSEGSACLTLWLSGYPEQALQKGQGALTFARELSHPPSVVMALLLKSWGHVLRREAQEASALLVESINLCTEYGILTHLWFSRVLQGEVLIRQGNKAGGVQQIQETLSFMDSMEARAFQSGFFAYQAEGHGELGQPEIGLSLLTRALDYVEQSGERLYEAELHRLKGELLLQEFQVSGSKFQVPPSTQAAAQEAEECFLKAIDIAQKQQAKSWELRASTSLARLWQSQGKKDDAHKLLADVYNWFTEGFDTKDLQEAKTLIQELSH